MFLIFELSFLGEIIEEIIGKSEITEGASINYVTQIFLLNPSPPRAQTTTWSHENSLF